MARTQPQSLEMNTFVKGLITEASPLTFPDNASLDEVNMVLNRDGSRQRRLGMDYEDEFDLIDMGIDLSSSTDALRSFRWNNVGNKGSLDMAVVQSGNDLYFFDANTTSISATPVNKQLTSSAVTVSLSGDATVVVSTTSLYGKLIVTQGTQSVLVLSYDADTDTIAEETVRLTSRDLWGLDDGLGAEERPLSLSVPHHYNLRNQGWPDYFRGEQLFNPTDIRHNPIYYTESRKGFYPSHSDIVWIAKDTTDNDAEDIGSFNPDLLDYSGKQSITPPKGRVLVDIFNRGQSRRDNLTSTVAAYQALIDTIPLEASLGGISKVASYAGRAFYAVEETGRENGDDASPSLGSMVFFSQVGSSTEDLGKCHSSNDLTSEDFNETLATDGGFIVLPEAGEILALEPMGDSLFVIASNGVWEIHGGDSSFSATNQGISKTSNVGSLSSNTVVPSEGLISYWSSGGIYVITIDPSSLRGKVDNLTQSTIQSLYDSISDVSKSASVGVYDEVSRQLRWLYRDGTLPSTGLYNRELVFDLNLQAFYKVELKVLDTRSPYVAGYVDVTGTLFNYDVEDVTVSSVTVTVVGEDVTVTSRVVEESVRSSTKYLSARQNSGDSNWSFTFSQFNELDFYDWKTADGTGKDSAGYILTGYLTGGDSQRDKKSNYLTCHLRRTEQGFTDDGSGNLTPISPSSCLVQPQWEWVNNTEAGRWGTEFQAYRLPRSYTPVGVGDDFSSYGFTVVSTKNKLRGKGRALSLLFSTEEGKDLHLYGWGLNLSATGNI